MQSNKKLYITAILLLTACFLIFIAYSFSAPSRNENPDNQAAKSRIRSLATLKEMSFQERTTDGRIIQVKAASVKIRNKKEGFLRVAYQKVAEMEDVRVVFKANGKEVIAISSDNASLILGGKNILFTGNVTCYSDEKGRVITDTLYWDNKKKQLKTDDHYVYTGINGNVKKGRGLVINHEIGTGIFINNIIRGGLL